MNGFAPFLRKEFNETVRTWRLWVLPGFLLFAALSSPLVTYLMPTLLDRLGSAQQGFSITVADPTALQAYLEYLGNLERAHAVRPRDRLRRHRERRGPRRHGGAHARQAALARRLRHRQVALAGGGDPRRPPRWGRSSASRVTQLLFDGGPSGRTVLAVALWAAYALMLLAVMVLLSIELKAPAAASGAGVGVYAALLVLAQFEVTSGATPAGLPAAGLAIVRGEPAQWAGPLVATVVVTAACLVAAVLRFERREI